MAKLTTHGDCLPKDVLQDMFAELDVDNDGSVSIQEFGVLIGPLKQKIDKLEVTDDELKDAFNAFDRNKDGSLDARELTCVLREFGVDLSLQTLETVMNEVDENNDGTVDQDEFARMIRHQIEVSASRDGSDDKGEQVTYAHGSQQLHIVFEDLPAT
eukprot:SAG31_NODE_15_length_37942_cov_32.078297_33_plen_157_part_00